MPPTRAIRTCALISTTALLAGLLPGAAALAHTPYLLPNRFDVQSPRVTLIGALTEDDYFTPDIALTVPAYVETLPDGRQVEIKTNAILKDLAATEVAVDAPGTYRFSTGQFVGRTQTFVKVGDKWLFVRQPRGRPPGEGGPPAPGGGERGEPHKPAAGGPPGGEGPPNSIAQADVPAGAPTMQVEGVTVAETYVTKGAPTDTAVKTTGHGFELKPASHPNAIYMDQGLAFQLLVDGQPAVNFPVSVYRDGNIYDDRRIAAELRTDAKGMGKVAFDRPGIYLLTTHTPGATPGQTPAARNYTYSLTFEVTR